MFQMFIEMADKVLTKYKNVTELAELHWRIEKLEAMKKGKNKKEQVPGNKGECTNQNQSSEFFLRLGLPKVVESEDEST